MSKCETIFSKNIFISFETSILIFINKYLVVFLHLLIITKIELYMILSRLLEDKSMIKFMKISFQDTLNINKKFNF